MDQKMPLKLPRYVFRRPNGSFRYKRNVPKDLRPVIQRTTVYRQLGQTYDEAMSALPKVHSEIEALFNRERRTTDADRARALIRERLGDVAESMFMGDGADPEWPDYDDFQELAEDIEYYVPKGVAEQIRATRYKAPPMNLDRVLDEYAAYKDVEGDVGLRTRLERLRKDLKTSMGKHRYEWTPLAEVTRADANAFRDLLLARMSPNSVQRNLGVIKAAINHVLLEHDLDIRNVFQAVKIKGAGSSKNDRLPMSEEQLAEIMPAFETSEIAKTIFILLTDTGARLAEITGLETRDADLDQGLLHIRPNGRRGLKTKNSTRSIPLSPRATECLKKLASARSDGEPFFPQYAAPRGSDKASAMLMKRLRSVISDKKITMHSLRHRMKDKLRNTGCPEAVSQAILGHSSNTVAANYGVGYAHKTMREHMKKVWDF
ncbi:tyrosine-type recombinase/integrase [Marivivens marinus]|uniref:tyrosine-type recombinase/integrase n=1 Tax=Marivivens marinus TaxID=3110173 RepID=UPI003B84B414